MNEILLRLYNDLTIMNGDEPIIVSNGSDGLIFRQIGKVVNTPYITHLMFVEKRFKYGVLTPIGFNKLMNNLQILVQDKQILDNNFGMIIGNYKTEFYKIFSGLRNPQKFSELSYLDFSNQIISDIYLKHFSNNSRILLNSLKHENSISKSKKPIRNSSAS